MRKITFLYLLLAVTQFTFAQTPSEYYQPAFDTTIHSASLGEKRAVTVILPRSFNKANASRYPLIIVFDRQNKRIFRQVFESINYLVSFDEAPEAVIIGIYTENNRNRLLETSLLASDPKAKGEKFTSFVFQELIPLAEKEYNCSKDRFLIGHSRFGYFSSYLLANKLSEVSGVISLSPFFIQKNINVVDSLRSSLERNKLSHHVYYRFVVGDTVSDGNDYIRMKSALRNDHLPAAFDWKDTEIFTATHMVTPGLGVMPSLFETFNFWATASEKILKDEKTPFNSAEYLRFKAGMKEHYGDSIGLSIGVLNGIAYKYYNTDRFKEAIAAWEVLIQQYPAFTEAYIAIGDSYRKAGDKQAATKAYTTAKLQLKTSSFYSDGEKSALMADIEEGMKEVKSE